MITYYLVPGLGNSGPAHWQTYFESVSPRFQRILQKEWDAPLCDDWIETIDETLRDTDLSQVVLIGHSLGCTTIAQWATRYRRQIRGAMLVAPSDVENPVYTFPAKGFTPIPLQKIPFPTVVVASGNDPWVSLTRALFFAEQWGSEFVNIGNAGHINADAGYYKWEEGLAILKRF